MEESVQADGELVSLSYEGEEFSVPKELLEDVRKTFEDVSNLYMYLILLFRVLFSALNSFRGSVFVSRPSAHFC